MRREYREVTGILVLDKPTGLTSNAVLQKVRRLYQARKAGHTGSLDPLASGLLPICFGEATKLSGLLLEAPKTYEVTARLGTRTDTGDAHGEPIEQREWAGVNLGRVKAVLDDFLGHSDQVPPMYSALKHRGRRLYQLARRGETVERAPRRIRVDAFDHVRLDGAELCFRVRCSKGTYVRTLVEDIAAALGTVAHVTGLRRVGAGALAEEDLVTMDDLERAAGQGLAALDALLLPPDEALPQLPAVHLDEDRSRKICLGQQVETSYAGSGTVRLYGHDGRFLGLGELGPENRVAPRRLFRTPTDKNGREADGPGSGEVVAQSTGKVQ